jgi:hypothetical protein
VTLHLHVYRFRLRALGSLCFPSFPGPALRGALGDSREVHALLFEPPASLPHKRFADPPRPVTLRPRFGAGTYATGSALEFEMTLVGSAGAHLLPIVRALVALGEVGVGARRDGSATDGRFNLERVDALGPRETAGVVTPEGLFRPVLLPWRFPDDFVDPPALPAHRFTLELRSPTFVRRRGETRGALGFRDLVDELLKRVSLLSLAYGDGPVYTREEEVELVQAAAEVGVEDAAVSWTEVPRYSRRQGRRMGFESGFAGWAGRVTYRGAPDRWLPLLRAAPQVHVGRHTAFGLGEVHLGP